MKNEKMGFFKRLFIQIIDSPFHPICGTYYNEAIRKEKELIAMGLSRKFTASELNEFESICEITRNYIDEWGVYDKQKKLKGKR